MTIRVTDEAAEAVDRKVARQMGASRAEYINWLILRAAQEERAWADIRKLRTAGALGDPYPELEGLAEYAATVDFDDLD